EIQSLPAAVASDAGEAEEESIAMSMNYWAPRGSHCNQCGRPYSIVDGYWRDVQTGELETTKTCIPCDKASAEGFYREQHREMREVWALTGISVLFIGLVLWGLGVFAR